MKRGESRREKRRERIYRILAFAFSMVVLLICLLLPMYVFRVVQGIPLDARGPEVEIWFLIVGGGIGAGAAYLVAHLIFCRVGRFSEQVLNRLWTGNRKLSTNSRLQAYIWYYTPLVREGVRPSYPAILVGKEDRCILGPNCVLLGTFIAILLPLPRLCLRLLASLRYAAALVAAL